MVSTLQTMNAHGPMNQCGTSELHNVIRLALPDDAPAIARVLSESFAAHEPLYMAEAFAATTPNAEQIEPRFREGPI